MTTPSPLTQRVPVFLAMLWASMWMYAMHPAQAGKATVAAALLGGTFGMALGAVRWLRAAGQLEVLLKPKRGDIALGGLLGIGLLGLAIVGHRFAWKPGTAAQAWELRLYSQLLPGTSKWLGLWAVALTVGEELIWRGWLMEAAKSTWPKRPAQMAWMLSVLAALPSAWLVSDAALGLNPLWVGATMVSSGVWTLLRVRTNRILPGIIGHALLAWLLVDSPLIAMM